MKAIEKRLQKVTVHDHVVIQKYDDFGAGMLHTAIVAPGKSIVSIERKKMNLWEMAPDKLRTSVGASIVDHHNLMITTIETDRVDHRRKAFRKQVFAIPIKN